jgi:crotonobetainyl-CoA:carnitine CoA-transferase CaiB-like acyl-CoA transferase
MIAAMLTTTALAELTALAGLDPAASPVELTGADPVFPTRYRIGTAGAAVLAAVGLAASELWALRTGRRQRVAVDVRAAAASLRSTAYLRLNGEKRAAEWDPFSGFYPVKAGGWIRLHCNFPHHRDHALAVLGASEREAAERASLTWDGEALEEAIHAKGGCAGFVRSAAEWQAHPQAKAVAGLPLLEIARIGDAPPEALPHGDRPLSSIRVLDLTRVLAGPTAAKTLAEHGAEVLKISGAHLPHSGDVEYDTGIGKLAAHLDLRDAAERETLHELVRGADVFSQAYRPGALAGRGFSPEDLAALCPGIVSVNLSAWGDAGPWRGRRGFDSIVQSVSGMAQDSAGDDGTPRLLPVSAIDYVSGYLMALGAMVALKRRAREGGSWRVTVALARVGQWIVDRGLEDKAALASVAKDLTDEEIARLTTDGMTADGIAIRHLAPVTILSETPGRWSRPPAPLGYHKPSWP